MLTMLAIWDGWLRGDTTTILMTIVIVVAVSGAIYNEVERQRKIDREKELLELARRQEERERERDGSPDA